MIQGNPFEIKQYDFNADLLDALSNQIFIKDLWPIVYILSDGEQKSAYIGETTDALARMNVHLKNQEKSKLTAVHLIESALFNKSAALDIESNLIKYISGDGQYQLLNANLGLANHNYYQKEQVYWGMFTSIWNYLRSLGISRHSIEYIDNSDLFKYSPYKTLSKEQRDSLELIIDSLTDKNYKSVIIQGGAGTGKTILAVFLFKLLMTDLSDFNFKDLYNDEGNTLIKKVERLKELNPNPSMALVVPMSSFRNTLKKVFSKVKGLTASMVIGPADVANQKYDIVVVDEAHRLRRRVNLGAYYGAFDRASEKLGFDKKSSTELDWIKKQARTALYFYDESQSIKPSDVEKGDFVKIKKNRSTRTETIRSQFRVRGGNGYVEFVRKLLNISLSEGEAYDSDRYELKLFTNISELTTAIRHKNEKLGLSRIIAGYSWKWVSKNNPNLFDITIQDVQLKWNSTNSDWINSPNAIDEVGCIHTTQGYDLNYAGIIFGHEIGYDKERKEIIIRQDKYYDRNGKQSIRDPKELKDFILNIYKTILLRGIKGTYIYVCDSELREYIAGHIPSNLGLSVQMPDQQQEEPIPYENSVPLYDFKVAAGAFTDDQVIDESMTKWVVVPKHVKPSEELFVCEVIGESMNKIIHNGSLCLFRKYSGGSRNGKIVLVQSSSIQDTGMGSGYTVKEYYSKKVVNEFDWEHQQIILRPLSTDSSFEEIVLEADSLESFKVIGIFDRVLY